MTANIVRNQWSGTVLVPVLHEGSCTTCATWNSSLLSRSGPQRNTSGFGTWTDFVPAVYGGLSSGDRTSQPVPAFLRRRCLNQWLSQAVSGPSTAVTAARQHWWRRRLHALQPSSTERGENWNYMVQHQSPAASVARPRRPGWEWFWSAVNISCGGYIPAASGIPSFVSVGLWECYPRWPSDPTSTETTVRFWTPMLVSFLELKGLSTSQYWWRISTVYMLQSGLLSRSPCWHSSVCMAQLRTNWLLTCDSWPTSRLAIVCGQRSALNWWCLGLVCRRSVILRFPLLPPEYETVCRLTSPAQKRQEHLRTDWLLDFVKCLQFYFILAR
jgi:hypothetical protein